MKIEIETLLKNYPDNTSSLAKKLRRFLLANFSKDVNERIDHKAHLIAYGYGAGYKGLLCVILVSRKGVKLGFYNGRELSDPDNLLTGSGKMHRYAIINSEADIQSPALKRLLDSQLVKRAAFRNSQQ